MRASPFARRRASELGVDLGAVHRHRPGRRHHRRPTSRQPPPGAQQPPPAPEPSPTPDNGVAGRPHGGAEVTQSDEGSPKEQARAKQAAMRAAIGDLMARSKREIPHYYLTQSIDLRTAMEWMREVNAGRGGHRAPGPCGAAAQGGGRRRGEGARGQRLLRRRRRSSAARASTSGSRSRCAAAGSWRRRSTTRRRATSTT